MSNDSDTTNTRTLHAAPEPEPLTGLTGAPAAIYTELVGLTEPATAAELALAAGLGRSTTSKALTTLEQHGLALREPGGHDGPRRTPDRWRLVQTSPTPDTDAKDTVNAEPTSDGPDTAQPPAQDTTGTAPESAPETAAPTTDTPAPDTAAAPAPSMSDTAEGAPESDTSADGAVVPPTQQPTPAPGQKVRLAPGGLRQMVVAHLTAHPDEAFTATRISRVLEKSSGAIANCLATLVKQQIAQQVSDTPRTYQLANPATDGK
ncbi:helix-turn-helix domain-containing protein [Streptomyces sp. WM6378]|uniref:helix-turn-helix domain-containing protein n=1 Tax=Streptomyces sp. WM6378 TaxID=1415557 RepID=UPI0006AF44B0|nr:helix-turn-helix domain-containing protein [Streptomyces sp. WM6378]